MFERAHQKMPPQLSNLAAPAEPSPCRRLMNWLIEIWNCICPCCPIEHRDIRLATEEDVAFEPQADDKGAVCAPSQNKKTEVRPLKIDDIAAVYAPNPYAQPDLAKTEEGRKLISKLIMKFLPRWNWEIYEQMINITCLFNITYEELVSILRELEKNPPLHIRRLSEKKFTTGLTEEEKASAIRAADNIESKFISEPLSALEPGRSYKDHLDNALKTDDKIQKLNFYTDLLGKMLDSTWRSANDYSEMATAVCNDPSWWRHKNLD